MAQRGDRQTQPMLYYCWYAAAHQFIIGNSTKHSFAYWIIQDARTYVYGLVCVSVCAPRKIINWLNVNLWFANIYFFSFHFAGKSKTLGHRKTRNTLRLYIVCFHIVACVQTNEGTKLNKVRCSCFQWRKCGTIYAAKISTFHGNIRTMRRCIVTLHRRFHLNCSIWTVHSTFYQLHSVYLCIF